MDAPQMQALGKWKFWRVVKSPAVWLPAIAGLGAVVAAGLSGDLAGWLGLGGGLAVFAAAAAGLAKWTWGGAALTRGATIDMQRAEATRHLAYLSRLRRKMRRDRDPHTSQLVRKLRRIYERLQATRREPEDESQQAVSEVYDQVLQLYRSCLDLLERSLQLWLGAREMATADSRTHLLASREALVTRVEESIDYLDATLDQLRAAALEPQPEAAATHTRLRSELDEGLHVARRVEERMQALEQELRLAERG